MGYMYANERKNTRHKYANEQNGQAARNKVRITGVVLPLHQATRHLN